MEPYGFIHGPLRFFPSQVQTHQTGLPFHCSDTQLLPVCPRDSQVIQPLRIVGINFNRPGANLSDIFQTIANFSQLQDLTYSNQAMTGPLPSALPWASLKALDLSNNLFSGPIPEVYCQLNGTIDLRNNPRLRLRGPLPANCLSSSSSDLVSVSVPKLHIVCPNINFRQGLQLHVDLDFHFYANCHCEPGFAGVSGKCVACPPGRFSSPNTTMVSAKGEWPLRMECQPCPRDTFSSGLGATACFPCPRHFSTYNGTGFQVCETTCPDFSALSSLTTATDSPKTCMCQAEYYMLVINDTHIANDSELGPIAERWLHYQKKSGSHTNDQLLQQARFQLLDPFVRSACLPCPKGANCNRAGISTQTVLPLAGWGYSAQSQVEGNAKFFKCQEGHCVGREYLSDSYETLIVNGSSNLCLDASDAYTGPQCRLCQEGHARSRDGTSCVRCMDAGLEILFALFVTVLAVMFAYGLIRLNLRSALHAKKSPTATYIKIFVNALQINVSCYAIRYEWPTVVSALFNVQTISVNPTSFSVSSQCLWVALRTRTRPFLLEVILSVMFPFFIIGGVCGVYVYWFRTKRASLLLGTSKQATSFSYTSTSSSGSVFDSPVLVQAKIAAYRTVTESLIETTSTLILFMAHWGIAVRLFQALKCEAIDLSGLTYLSADISLRCFDSEHYVYLFAFVIPGLLLWVLGVPVFALFRLHQYRCRLEDVDMMARFSFLYKGYRLKYYYWEGVVIARKLAVVIVTILFDFSPHLQSLLILLIFMLAAFLQVNHQPFKGNELNAFELYSLLNSGLIFFLSQVFFITDFGPESAQSLATCRTIVSWLIFVLFATYVLVFLKICVRSLGDKWATLTSKFNNMRKILAKYRSSASCQQTMLAAPLMHAEGVKSEEIELDNIHPLESVHSKGGEGPDKEHKNDEDNDEREAKVCDKEATFSETLVRYLVEIGQEPSLSSHLQVVARSEPSVSQG